MIQNPLQSLTFIAAPALLTNSCSLLVLSTSNRFARAVDRTRLLAQSPPNDGGAALARIERRGLMLVRALTAFYIAVGAFAASTFVALIGSFTATIGWDTGLTGFTLASLFFATVGVLSIGIAAGHLVLETWYAFRGLLLEAQTIGKHRIQDITEV